MAGRDRRELAHRRVHRPGPIGERYAGGARVGGRPDRRREARRQSGADRPRRARHPLRARRRGGGRAEGAGAPGPEEPERGGGVQGQACRPEQRRNAGRAGEAPPTPGAGSIRSGLACAGSAEGAASLAAHCRRRAGRYRRRRDRRRSNAGGLVIAQHGSLAKACLAANARRAKSEISASTTRSRSPRPSASSGERRPGERGS